MAVILLVLSCIVLTLEVLETKIFAYCLANSLMFVVIGLALLGFGAGGTALTLRRQLGDPTALVRLNLLLTAALVVIAHAYFAQVSQELRFGFNFVAVSALVLLASPYFTAGMTIAAILGDPRANVARLYGMNLLGSALGCCSLFVLLGPLTGPECLALCATACGLLGAALCPRRLVASLAVLAAGGLVFVQAEAVFPYKPEPAETRGQLALLEKSLNMARDVEFVSRAELVEKFDRWDPTARVQVHDVILESTNSETQATIDSLPNMWFTQDSSYGSPLLGNGPGRSGFFERTLYGAGYFRRQPDTDVLVIGLGGAPDVQAALHFDPRSVTGVDINRTTIGMVRDDMSDYLGDPYGDPRVRIVIRDGRSFARSDRGLYDLIQMSGVDTKSVMSAGTLAINESYLYTLEGFEEYLARLKPGGLLCIVYAGDDYMHRLAITAMAALENLGADAPHRHIVLLRQSAMVTVMVKRTPFTEAECAQLDAWIAACDQGGGTTGVFLAVYELLEIAGGLNLRNLPTPVFVPDGRPTSSPVMRAARTGELGGYLAAQRFDLSPVTDSRPFFFNLARNEQVWSENRPDHFKELFTVAKIMIALAVLLIAAPLLVFKARGIQIVRNLPFSLYFAALGAGFILAEIGLIQRYVLFLGHQAYAFPAVIGGLLVAAGLGSLWSARLQRAPDLVIGSAVAVAALVIAAHHLFLDSLFGLTADLPLLPRVVVAVAVLLPLGVPLGMLFPTGLSLVRGASPLFVPWAFGINGVFSVIGTTIAVPGAMLYGFPTMAALAAGVYVLAGVIAVPAARRMAAR